MSVVLLHTLGLVNYFQHILDCFHISSKILVINVCKRGDFCIYYTSRENHLPTGILDIVL